MAPEKTVVAALCALLLAGAAETLIADSHANDWPQFRGHHRDGVSRETGLVDDWGEDGPDEVWRVPIGEGYSGIAVVGDRLYTMFAAEPEGDGEDGGEELWRTPVGDKLDTEFGNGPRATPTVDGDMIFVLGSHGDLAAIDRASGDKRWHLSLTETFGSQRPYWGFSASATASATS